MIEIMSIQFENGQPKNARLAELAKDFCDREFGQGAVEIGRDTALWVAVKGGAGEVPEVIGVMGLTAVMDMPFLHVTNKRSKIEAAAVSSKLIRRLQDYMIDRGLEGKWLLVHCSPEAVDLWKEFFERMNAVPAERYLIRVKPGIEV